MFIQQVLEFPGVLAPLQGRDVFLGPATLRPETMYVCASFRACVCVCLVCVCVCLVCMHLSVLCVCT